MTLTALRDDALVSAGDGFVLRLGLPWIRSLPLASLEDLAVTIDGEPVDGLTVQLDGRDVGPAALADEDGWWFLQDRLAIRGDRRSRPRRARRRRVVPARRSRTCRPARTVRSPSPSTSDASLTLDAAAPTAVEHESRELVRASRVLATTRCRPTGCSRHPPSTGLRMSSVRSAPRPTSPSASSLRASLP